MEGERKVERKKEAWRRAIYWEWETDLRDQALFKIQDKNSHLTYTIWQRLRQDERTNRNSCLHPCAGKPNCAFGMDFSTLFFAGSALPLMKPKGGIAF